MKVEWFRLSGVERYGDDAQRLFDIALEHGFNRIGADFTPWPATGKPARFIADVGVSGVAAAAQVSFDDAEALLSFLCRARLTEPSAEAVECYRRLAGYPTEAADHD